MAEKRYRLGQTIVGARGRDREVELLRIAERRKRRRRNIFVWAVVLIFVVGLGVFGAIYVGRMVAEREEAAAAVVFDELAPTVPIVVEGGGRVSARVREFVARLERDFADLGLSVSRVVLPLGMSREVDVYLAEFLGYFKMSVGRGSSLQAEDAARMILYLDEVGVSGVGYVDLRVEGRAYYK